VSPVTVIVIAFLVALPVMAGAFAGGAVIVALPVAVVGIATIALLDFNRRRKRARSMGELRDQAKAQRVDFTDRDRETLTPE
jgi:Flp pilus assembly protein TadB